MLGDNFNSLIGYNMISALDELLKVRGRQNLDPAELHISGSDPVLDSPFKLGEVAAAAHAAVGVAVNDLWEQKTGRRQKIQISVRSAAASLIPAASSLITSERASGTKTAPKALAPLEEAALDRAAPDSGLNSFGADSSVSARRRSSQA